MKLKNIKNRHIVGIIVFLTILNYFMICYNVDRNPFDILPSWPVIDNRQEVDVFLPSVDGKTLFTEKRFIAQNENSEIYLRRLVKFVIGGSKFENTKEAVPIEGNIRKVWINENRCLVDLYFETNIKNIKSKANREDNFKKALHKTITTNMPDIKEVVVLLNGIPDKKLWE